MKDLNAVLASTTDTYPSYVSIILEEIRLSQDHSKFCRKIRARLGKGRKFLSCLTKTMSYINPPTDLSWL